jgi:hypothetical protein
MVVKKARRGAVIEGNEKVLWWFVEAVGWKCPTGLSPRRRDQLGRSTRSERGRTLCKRAGVDSLCALPAEKTKMIRKRVLGDRAATGAEAEVEEEEKEAGRSRAEGGKSEIRYGMDVAVREDEPEFGWSRPDAVIGGPTGGRKTRGGKEDGPADRGQRGRGGGEGAKMRRLGRKEFAVGQVAFWVESRSTSRLLVVAESCILGCWQAWVCVDGGERAALYHQVLWDLAVSGAGRKVALAEVLALSGWAQRDRGRRKEERCRSPPAARGAFKLDAIVIRCSGRPRSDQSKRSCTASMTITVRT